MRHFRGRRIAPLSHSSAGYEANIPLLPSRVRFLITLATAVLLGSVSI